MLPRNRGIKATDFWQQNTCSRAHPRRACTWELSEPGCGGLSGWGVALSTIPRFSLHQSLVVGRLQPGRVKGEKGWAGIPRGLSVLSLVTFRRGVLDSEHLVIDSRLDAQAREPAMAQYRHGDLLLERVEALPPDAQPLPSHVLAEGENTGHAHRMDSSARVYCDGAGNRYVRARATTALTHEEHARIDLPPGLYRVLRQREFVISTWGTREVED